MKRISVLCLVCLLSLFSCGNTPDLTIAGHDWTFQTMAMEAGVETLVVFCAPELAEQYPEAVSDTYTWSFIPDPEGTENTFLLQSLYRPDPEYTDSDHSICTFTLTEIDKATAVYAMQITGDEGDGDTLDGHAVVSMTYENDKPVCYTLLLTYSNAEESSIAVTLTSPYTK
ncbi:MAG: hypothetical protein IKY52_00215 [Clostridia bacterium]|nr:hypothetical protein [Clostridia bacterium]